MGSRNISSPPQVTHVGGNPLRSALRGDTGLLLTSAPCRYAVVGMFHGKMSWSAFSVTDFSSRRRSTSGEKSNSPAGRTGLIRLGVFEENGVGQPAAARVAGEEDPLAGDAPAISSA